MLVKKNEALIANISGGVITFAVYQGKIKCEAVSEGACKLLGYTQEEMLEGLRKSDNFRIHPDDILRINDAIAKAIKGHTNFKQQYRILSKNGAIVWVEVIANPVTDFDGIVRFYCSYTDITELKNIDIQKDYYAKLIDQANNANKAKTEFLSHMSHDVRTSMNAIINMTKIIRDDYIGTGNGIVKRHSGYV